MKNKWLENKQTTLDRVNVRRLLLYIQGRHLDSVKNLSEYMTLEEAAAIAHKHLKILMEGIVKNKGIVNWRLTNDPMEFKLDIQPIRAADYITLNFNIE